MLTQERLKELLHYNPDTGDIIRLSTGNTLRTTNSHGYFVVEVDKVLYYAHRIAWMYIYGEFPYLDIDHINGDKVDNRIVNLREACDRTNGRNKKQQSNNKTGVTGVSYEKKSNTWRVNISTNDKRIYVTCYTLLDAVCVRKNLEREHGYHKNHGRRI